MDLKILTPGFLQQSRQQNHREQDLWVKSQGQIRDFVEKCLA